MVANTEPIFIRSLLHRSVRVQTGTILQPTVAPGLTAAGTMFVNCQERPEGALITDLWCQPLAAISTGFFLRFFLTDYDALSINLLAEVAISASSGSPLVRQELGSLLPEVLSPTQTALAGKKKGLYIAGNQSLTIGLSADLPGALVVSCQGGYY